MTSWGPVSAPRRIGPPSPVLDGDTTLLWVTNRRVRLGLRPWMKSASAAFPATNPRPLQQPSFFFFFGAAEAAPTAAAGVSTLGSSGLRSGRLGI